MEDGDGDGDGDGGSGGDGLGVISGSTHGPFVSFNLSFGDFLGLGKIIVN
jgi:hypothetical protein